MIDNVNTGPSVPVSAPEGASSVRWGPSIHRRHADRPTFPMPRPVSLDREWDIEPESCLTGFRVIALRAADGVFVCPLCGLRTT